MYSELYGRHGQGPSQASQLFSSNGGSGSAGNQS